MNSKRILLPGVIKADTIHSLNLSIDFRYLKQSIELFSQCTRNGQTHIRGSLRATSSMMSRLALAIIWMTCGSWPPPIRSAPPEVCWVALDAPERAVRVPANADVDHVGKFEAKGDVATAAGLLVWCVSVYSGVSDGDSKKRWWDMVNRRRLDSAHIRLDRSRATTATLSEPLFGQLSRFSSSTPVVRLKSSPLHSKAHFWQ